MKRRSVKVTQAIVYLLTFTSLSAQGIQPGEPDKPYYDTAHHALGNFHVIAHNGNGISGYFPRGSKIYAVGVGIHIGAIVDNDIIVSGEGEWQPDVYPKALFRRKSIDNYNPFWAPDATSELDLTCDFYDTLGITPLGLKVTQKSMTWSGKPLDEFVLVHYTIKNMLGKSLKSVFVGLKGSLYPMHNEYLGDNSHGAGTHGFLREWPSGDSCDSKDALNIVYGISTDGDPRGGQWDYASGRSAGGLRILSMPCDFKFNFNWYGNYVKSWDILPERYWWGPSMKPADGVRTPDLGEGIYFPEGDTAQYYYLSHPEFDYDQMFAAISHTAKGWLAPHKYGAEFAGNASTSISLSFGGFDLGPGQTAEFTIAIVAGDSVHVNPTDFEDLWDPQNPSAFYNSLDFTALARNANWAKWVYDNPGYDTDGDGYAGEFRVCGDDTTWIQGDKVPDFRADYPPPSPDLRIVPLQGKLVIRWNGYETENYIDWFTRTKDFEGYRLYAGLDSRESAMTLLASYDRENFNRFTYYQYEDGRIEWKNRELPFTLGSLRLLYDDPEFEPLSHTRNEPLVHNDSFFFFETQDYNIDDLSRQDGIHKVYPNATNPGTDSTIWSEEDVTYEHGRRLPKYYEYEYIYDELASTLSYYVAVTAFDFGFAKGGMPSKESSVYDNMKESYAATSSDSVEAYNLEAYVYPNPWRADADYRGRGLENRDQTELVNRSRRIHFANLPSKCTISIFSLDGDLVREIDHDKLPSDPDSMHDSWNLVTRNHMLSVSGLYYFVIESEGRSQIGKFVIIM